MPKPIPDLTVEHELLVAGYRTVAGIDEVGRGAWAGPVTCGVVVIDASALSVPDGITDSKHLTERQRHKLLPVAQEWALAYAVGDASPAEIDRFGIVAALQLAAHRAVDALDMEPDVVLLDGNHDYFTVQDNHDGGYRATPVRTVTKGDERCGSVSAASIIAKVHRDGLMAAYTSDHPHFGWERNAGYMSAAHRQAVADYGLTALHRMSWSVPA